MDGVMSVVAIVVCPFGGVWVVVVSRVCRLRLHSQGCAQTG